MKIQDKGYDISFAVKVRNIMLYTKWQGNEDRKRDVWDPTKDFLESFALLKPTEITCFYGREFQYPSKIKCACRNIFLINCRKKVLYLGTVFNKEAMKAYCKRTKQKCLGKVIRDQVYFIIPSKKEQINEAEIMKAVKKCLSSYRGEIPQLARATISFLSEKFGEEMDDTIRLKAKVLSDRG